MKTMNYIKIGIASSILSIAAGCTSFLEEDLKSSLAPDNTYTSSLGFEVGATGLYAIARSEYNTWGENGAFMHNGACAYEVLQISTDLCRMGTVRDGSLVPFAEMTLNPSTLFVGSDWNWAYNLIASANELLIYSEKNDNWDYPTDKQLYQAEARFFRAYAYRTLVYLYGDVPWVETIQKPFLLSFSRDPKIEVLGNIIKDLEFAKTYLPDNPDNVKEGKLTTWAARHLLSEMYLLRGAEGDYKLAEENAQDVIDCEREIERIEREAGIPVGTTGMMAAIESANGVLNAVEIAKASDRLIGIALGAEDYVTDLKTTRSDGIELLFARCMILNAARAAGIAALDTVFSNVNDEEGFIAEATLIKKLGFDGKSVINPRQIEPLHKVFMPSEKDLNKARAIMEAIAEANARGSGVASLNGKMIDKPVVTRAKRLLELYEAGSKADEVEEL